ncbi:MAG TPA: GNAT family N-acetyltransferase [Gemmatimonadaceae bacterium]|nr:GNAT family N-acetyltransferase [Gemmatimonadaceae bacterium]
MTTPDRDALARAGYSVSADPARLDLVAVHAFLSRTFWSPGIPLDVVRAAAANSLCFGVYHGAAQVGFARVITDRTTFAYLADVYVLEEHRGRGLAAWLTETVLAHPELQGLRRFMLMTRDAAGLYAKFGFTPMPEPSGVMIKRGVLGYLQQDRATNDAAP